MSYSVHVHESMVFPSTRCVNQQLGVNDRFFCMLLKSTDVMNHCAATASTMHFVFVGSLTCTHSDTVQLQLMWVFDYLDKLVEHCSNGVFSPVLLRCWNIYDPCRALLPHCAAEVVHSARGSECLETFVQRTFDDFWSLVFKKNKYKKYTYNITQHIYVSPCYTDEITMAEITRQVSVTGECI